MRTTIARQGWGVRAGWAARVTMGLMLLALFGPGCGGGDDAPGEGESGTVRVSVSVEEAKTIWPSGWADSIGAFGASLRAPDGTIQRSWGPADPAQDEIVFHDVPHGTWWLSVDGFCDVDSPRCTEEGEPLRMAAGASDAFTVSGEETRVTVPVGPLTGDGHEGIDGWLDLRVSWPVGQLITRVEREVRPVTEPDFGPVTVFDSFAVVDGREVMQVADRLALDNGSHVVRLRLVGGGGHVISTVLEVVNIYGNYLTEGEIALTDDDFQEPTGPSRGDLEFVVDWTGEPARQLLFVGTFNDWDITNAAAMDFEAPRTTLLVPGVVDGPIEFKMCNDIDWDCWAFANGITWSFVGNPVSLAPYIPDTDNQQLRIDAEPGEDIRVVIDVNSATITVTAGPDPDAGKLEVDLVVIDPAPAVPLELECMVDGADLLCTHSGEFSAAATWLWHLDGTPLAGETSETLALPLSELRPGSRLTLLVQDPPFAYSASTTVTADMLDP